MKFARYQVTGKTHYGIVEKGDVRDIEGDIFGKYAVTGPSRPLEEVNLLAPCRPSKVLAVGLNYKSHLAGRKVPEVPGIFLKTPSALLDPEDTIILPKDVSPIEPEGEVVVVIGRRARNVPPGEALDCVFGYSCGNDVSARPWQRNDLQWWRAKATDTFAPLGPIIVTDLKHDALTVRTRINGEVKQEGNTSELIFDIPTIVSFISSVMTLEPGDVIYTGTPGTPGQIKAGDVVEVEVEGVGVLRNHVAEGE